MIEWLVALGLDMAFLATMPWLLRWMRTAGGKGKMGGVALALGVAFSFLFDPAKAAAMENVDGQKRRASARGCGRVARLSGKKKAAPKDGRESLRRGCLKGPIFVHRSGTYRKCEMITISLQKLQLSNVVSCARLNCCAG